MDLPYRDNVGAVVFNPAGLVLVARRADLPNAEGAPGGWQLPQGGMDPGEDPSVAVFRELEEEVGTARAEIMAEHALVTLQLVWPKSKRKYYARNPFPPGGVVEDPATGAAAAAFGGYLRDLGLIGHTASFTIRQGAEMGRPSLIEVSVMEGEPGVRVRGLASLIEAD